jgi:hypothetical protein
MCVGGVRSSVPAPQEITFKGVTIEVGKDATVITDHDTGEKEIDFKEGDTITASPPKQAGKAEAAVTLEMEPTDIYVNKDTGYSVYVDHNGDHIELEDSDGNKANLPKGATVTKVDTNDGTVEYKDNKGNSGVVFLKPDVITAGEN